MENFKPFNFNKVGFFEPMTIALQVWVSYLNKIAGFHYVRYENNYNIDMRWYIFTQLRLSFLFKYNISITKKYMEELFLIFTFISSQKINSNCKSF